MREGRLERGKIFRGKDWSLLLKGRGNLREGERTPFCRDIRGKYRWRRGKRHISGEGERAFEGKGISK